MQEKRNIVAVGALRNEDDIKYRALERGKLPKRTERSQPSSDLVGHGWCHINMRPGFPGAKTTVVSGAATFPPCNVP